MKILIVDDSVFSQKVTANLLRKYMDNVDLLFANDGEEGFEVYKNQRPDVIFIDLLMPKVCGGDLIGLIKTSTDSANTPQIVVLTADVQDRVKDEIESLGILKFISKPFNENKAEEVCNMLRNEKNE